jgi:AcrR family transcriptional regulator
MSVDRYAPAVAPRKRRLTRDESKARTRSELLRAANRLFLRNGFHATSINDVAEEAGLTRGALYSNFETKDDLFLALLQEIGNPESPWINQDQLAPNDLSSATGATPRERAEQWGRAIAKIQPDMRNVALATEMNAAVLRSARTRAWVAGHNVSFFRELGDRLVAILDGRTEDAELLGMMAQTIYSGLIMHEAITGEPLGEEVYARAYGLLAELALSG